MTKLKLILSVEINDRNGIVSADDLRVKFTPLPLASAEQNSEYLSLAIAEFMVQGSNVPAIIERARELYNEHQAKQS